MAYNIKNADGTVLLNLVDGTTDIRTTSLTLIGKNTDAYGTALNTNLVQMLQNFASTTQPRSPLVGQLWYNKSDGRLKIFTLNGVFEEISSAILSDTKPTILKRGDLWIDTNDKQLYFTTDGINTTLAGPIYSSRFGKSGWISETFIDDGGNPQLVTSLYNNDTLLGILSTATFIIAPTETIPQNNQGLFDINPGLNLNLAIPNIRFSGTATNASAVQGITPELYVVKDNGGGDQVISGEGKLKLNSDSGIWIGSYDDLIISADGLEEDRISHIKNSIADSPLEFITKKSDAGGPDAEVVSLVAYRDRVGVNLDGQLPTTNFHVQGDSYFNGNATITGNLTVSGAQTILSTVVLQVQDKNIELATSSTWYTDALVDGGGVTLHGTTDKTITYNNSAKAWTSNIDWNLSSTTGTYKINNVTVITSSTLGINVTQTSITRVGIMEDLTVTNVIVQGSGISTKTGTYPITSVTASGVSTGSMITVVLSKPVPIIAVGSTITLDGIDNSYNTTYSISTVTNNSTFIVLAATLLSSTLPTLGANPIAVFNDLMLSAQSAVNTYPAGGIDVTNRRIKNVQYSSIPTDAATVQFAIDQGSVSQLKGFIITLDVSRMTNQQTEIAAILNLLAPPTNPLADSLYDLPVDYRARVLCQTTNVNIQRLPINVAATYTNVVTWPDYGVVGAVSNIGVSAGSYTTSTSVSYTVKEFRVASGNPNYWQWTKNI